MPLKYTIDAENCIYLEKGKCGACEKYCPSGAINFNDTQKTLTLQVGSVILAPGFKTFDPVGLDNYPYADLSDVVTSQEFERILSATGPYSGHLMRPSSMRGKNPAGKPPERLPGCNVWDRGILTVVTMGIVLRFAACTPSNRR